MGWYLVVALAQWQFWEAIAFWHEAPEAHVGLAGAVALAYIIMMLGIALGAGILAVVV